MKLSKRMRNHADATDFTSIKAVYQWADEVEQLETMEHAWQKTALEGREKITKLSARLQLLEAEVADWEASFKLYHNAIIRGTKEWQLAHPEIEYMPDTAKMMKWIVDRLDQLEAENERLWELANRVSEIRGHVHLGAIIGSMLDALMKVG